jgi:hypothetical protein
MEAKAGKARCDGYPMHNGGGGLRQGRIGDKGEGGVEAGRHECRLARWDHVREIAYDCRLEENKMVGKASWVANVAVPMQGSKAVVVRQEMEVGGVLGTMSVTMSMTILVTISMTMSVPTSVTMSVTVSVTVLETVSVRTVSATVSVTALVTVLVGVSRAVVEVLGPAAAMLVPGVELGPSGCWSRLGQDRNTVGTLHWVGGEHGWSYAAGRCARHSSSR